MNVYANVNAAQPQPEQPLQPVHPVPPEPKPFAFLPSFPALVNRLDFIARRIPWYIWVGGTVALIWWLNRRKNKAFKLLGTG